MATDMKRFTISVTDYLDKELDRLKQNKFYKGTQSEMIRYLIQLGIEASKKEKEPQTV